MENFQNFFDLIKEKFHAVLDVGNSRPSENYFVIRLNVTSGNEVDEILNTYRSLSNTNWIVWRSLQLPTRVVFHTKWVCHHHKRHKTKSSERNLDCQASIDVTIKKVNRYTKRNDVFLQNTPPLPGVLIINSNHSHQIDVADALRQLRVSDEVKAQFFNYFTDGMGPAEAHHFHENMILAEDETYENLANASINPTLRQINYLFEIWRAENLGNPLDPFTKLHEKSKIYEESGTTICISESSPWVVLIATPVMKRAQTLASSGEIIFIDSTTSCDSTGSTLTVLLTATKAGAVPIMVIVHQCQTTESYRVAFELIKEKFPICFGKQNAPLIFMSDNSAAEKAALAEAWPSSDQLLCHFHVAQAEWRYIWSSSGNYISKDEKPFIMKLFQNVMYSVTDEDLETNIKKIMELQTNYPKYVQRFRSLLSRKEEWVLLYRQSKLTRNHNTNNYSEATIRVLKDVILNRTKAFNIVALVDYSITIWDGYLTKKLLDSAYGRNKKSAILYGTLVKRLNKSLGIRVIDERTYEVQSETDEKKWYTVDANLGLCTCLSGISGAFCKHQCLLHEQKKISLPNLPVINCQERYSLGILALGYKCPKMPFFQSLRETTEMDVDLEPQELAEICDVSQNPTFHEQETSIPEGEVLVANEDKEEFIKEIKRLENLCDGAIPRFTMQRALKNMKRITSKEDAVFAFRKISFALGSNKRARFNTQIKVQPTSIARRRSEMCKGNHRVAAGRPSKNAKSKLNKRKRCLSLNIKLNQPNCKSHGSGH